MKIQKLAYFAHGWHLAVAGEPLIAETVQAWPYGPVIPALYLALKKYEAAPSRNMPGLRVKLTFLMLPMNHPQRWQCR